MVVIPTATEQEFSTSSSEDKNLILLNDDVVDN
jgi:hypothetical protein